MQRRPTGAKLAVTTATTAAVLALGAPGGAQPRTAPRASADAPLEVLPPQGGSGPAPDEGTPAEEKKGPTAPMAGYAYGDKAAAAGTRRHARYRARGPVVNMPGFEQTADGGSRLFVQLSEAVPVEERQAAGSVTYVLKGASPRVWNNTNPLVTVHFNTPVSRARLVPRGNDLLFVVELRAAATPTWKMNEGENKSATLTIDFPKGEYLSVGEPAPGARAGRPAPQPGRGKRATRPPPAQADAPKP